MRRICAFVVLPALTLLCTGPCSDGQAGNKKLLETKGWGSLTGRVVLHGDLPAPGGLPVPAAPAGNAGRGPWVVDPETNGVAEVFVYLKVPAGTFFPIHEGDRQRKDVIEISTPDRGFLPRVAAHYPSYFDGKQMVPTGQTAKLTNPTRMGRAFLVDGTPPYKNPRATVALPAGMEKVLNLHPQPLPVTIQDALLNVASARVMVFDHPYFAVTEPDGTYTIPRVPAGAEVSLMAWHEGVGYVLTKNGRAVTLKPGENRINFTVTPK